MNKRTLSINICFITIMAFILYLHVGSFFSYSYYVSMFENSSIIILLLDLCSLVYSPIALILFVGIILVSFLLSIGVEPPFLNLKKVYKEKIDYSTMWLSVLVVSFSTIVNYLLSASIMMEMDKRFNTYSFFDSISNSTIFSFMSLLVILPIILMFIISLIIVIKKRSDYIKKKSGSTRTLVMYLLSISGMFMAMFLYHKAFFIRFIQASGNLVYDVQTSVTSGLSGIIIKGVTIIGLLIILGLFSYLCIDWIKGFRYKLDILKLKKQEVRKDLNLTYEKRIVEDPIDFSIVGTTLAVLLLSLILFMSQINDIYTTLAYEEIYTSIKYSVWFIAANILPIVCFVGVVVGVIVIKRRNKVM